MLELKVAIPLKDKRCERVCRGTTNWKVEPRAWSSRRLRPSVSFGSRASCSPELIEIAGAHIHAHLLRYVNN
jgi:hypothetical protein